MKIPKPTWPSCHGQIHFMNCTRIWKAGMEWRKCKRCQKTAENAMQFGPNIANVYCLNCTCNECGVELETYEESTCQSCVEKSAE